MVTEKPRQLSAIVQEKLKPKLTVMNSKSLAIVKEKLWVPLTFTKTSNLIGYQRTRLQTHSANPSGLLLFFFFAVLLIAVLISQIFQTHQSQKSSDAVEFLAVNGVRLLKYDHVHSNYSGILKLPDTHIGLYHVSSIVKVNSLVYIISFKV